MGGAWLSNVGLSIEGEKKQKTNNIKIPVGLLFGPFRNGLTLILRFFDLIPDLKDIFTQGKYLYLFLIEIK